jgi:hypothetical protein
VKGRILAGWAQKSPEPWYDQTLNQMLFQWMSIHAGLHTWWNRVNQHLWEFGVPWSTGFGLGLPQEVDFENNPSDHKTWSIRCHVGIHVDFTSIFHSHTNRVWFKKEPLKTHLP